MFGRSLSLPVSRASFLRTLFPSGTHWATSLETSKDPSQTVFCLSRTLSQGFPLPLMTPVAHPNPRGKVEHKASSFLVAQYSTRYNKPPSSSLSIQSTPRGGKGRASGRMYEWSRPGRYSLNAFKSASLMRLEVGWQFLQVAGTGALV